jgi:hypothetical protein
VATRNRLAAAADAACGGPAAGPFGDPAALDATVRQGALRALRTAGFDTLVAVAPSEACTARLSGWLGPARLADGVALWTLP